MRIRVVLRIRHQLELVTSVMDRFALYIFVSTKIKHCRNLRLEPQFCEVYNAYLACWFRKFT